MHVFQVFFRNLKFWFQIKPLLYNKSMHYSFQSSVSVNRFKVITKFRGGQKSVFYLNVKSFIKMTT